MACKVSINRYRRKRDISRLQRIVQRHSDKVTVRIYIVLDNASSHKKEEVLRWCRENNVVLVFTATNGSWMNRIECHFDSLREHALRAGYPPNHLVLAYRIFAYLRWRNARKRKERQAALLTRKKVA